MSSEGLFVGLVSHDKSDYWQSQGPDGLAAQVSRRFAGSTIVINTRNLASEQGEVASPLSVQQSLSLEVQADRTWARYLERNRNLRWMASHTLRQMKRQWSRVSPPSPSTVQRLLNIEFSHMDLLARGLETGAEWLLILEDDAFSSDAAELAAGIEYFTKRHRGSHLVNLSRSFSFNQLGVAKLLTLDPSAVWLPGSTRRLLYSTKPTTNTVCAILYSREAALRIRDQLESMPIYPVLPIDWKLNMALVEMSETPSELPLTSWFLEPAPINQQSMFVA